MYICKSITYIVRKCTKIIDRYGNVWIHDIFNQKNWQPICVHYSETFILFFKKGFEMPINFFARVLQSHLRAHNANTGNSITSRDYSANRIENLVTIFVLRKPNWKFETKSNFKMKHILLKTKRMSRFSRKIAFSIQNLTIFNY